MANLICKYDVKTTSVQTKICGSIAGFTSMYIDGVYTSLATGYTFDTVGEHTIEWVLKDETKIASYAFQNCPTLISVVIPNTVTSIGNEAFGASQAEYGLGLTSVTIPDSVETIGDYAFIWSGLKTLIIGSGLKSIGRNAVGGCYRLEEIRISATSEPNVLSNTFEETGRNGTLYYPKGRNYSTWLSENGYYLGYYGWNGVEIDVPDTPTVTGSTIVCKYNVTSTPFETRICFRTSGFTSMYIDGVYTSLATGYTFRTVGEHTLEFVLKDKTSIGEYAFTGCSGLTSVVIPDSVRYIGNDAFRGCNDLTSVVIGSRVTSIGDSAFEYCYGLKGQLVIPDSVTSIGDNAFSSCSSLTSVVIPDSVTSIGYNAFSLCSGLTSVVIPDSVTTIGDSAFSSCSSLTSIVVDSNNTVYDSRENCNCIIETKTNTLIQGCKNSFIPNSVTSIGDYAFNDCTGLTSVVIPDSVTTIGGVAFCDCTGLKEIISYAEIAPTIYEYTFQNVATGGTLYYPEGSDYSQWLSTNTYRLGYYNWNGIGGDTPDTPDTGTTSTAVVTPFKTTLNINYDGTPKTSSDGKLRVGYSGATPNEPLIVNGWIKITNTSEVGGTFYGYDKVLEYTFEYDVNTLTDSRTGSVTFSAGDNSAYVMFYQDGKPTEPDEPIIPDIPEDSDSVTYAPIWRDTEYIFGGNQATYSIYVEKWVSGNTYTDELLFTARCYAAPNQTAISVLINKVCQNYMNSTELDFESVGISHSMSKFKLTGEYGNLLHTYYFINDWSYNTLTLGTKTNPIIPCIADGQKLFFSAFAQNSTSVKWGIVYKNGTTYSNTETINNDFYTNIIASSRDKNVQSFYFGNHTYDIIPKCKCKYVLYYSNPYGGFDWFPITGKVARKDNLTQYTITQNYNNTKLDFGKKRYLSTINVGYSLHTGWLTQAQSNRMWELMESNTVYLHCLEDNKIHPVIITNTEIEHKQKSRNQMMLSYEINVEFSQIRERL